MMKKIIIFLTITLINWLVTTTSKLYADDWMGRVVRVMDGDTMVVMRDNQSIKIRLAGIDTPEHGQPFAEEAKEFVQQYAVQQMVQIHEKEADRYGRIVAWVTRPGMEELGAALVRVGLAWRHIYYSKDKNLMALEQQARHKKIGLWSQPKPVPPWVWKQRIRLVN